MSHLVVAEELPDVTMNSGVLGVRHAFDPLSGEIVCRADLTTYTLWDALTEAAPALVNSVEYKVLATIPWRPIATGRFCLTCRTHTARPRRK